MKKPSPTEDKIPEYFDDRPATPREIKTAEGVEKTKNMDGSPPTLQIYEDMLKAEAICRRFINSPEAQHYIENGLVKIEKNENGQLLKVEIRGLKGELVYFYDVKSFTDLVKRRMDPPAS